MSSINNAYQAFKDGKYSEALLSFNHASDITFRIVAKVVDFFDLAGGYSYFSGGAKHKAKAIIGLILAPAIPGAISSTCALVKDTLLTITYLASTIILGLVALLTLCQIPGVNNTAKKSAILLLDSVCNMGIDTIGILAPYGSLALSLHSYSTFRDMID